jgi:hypothetical protein
MDWGSRDRYLREALLEVGFKIKNVKIKEGKKIITVEKSGPEALKSRRAPFVYHPNSEPG